MEVLGTKETKRAESEWLTSGPNVKSPRITCGLPLVSVMSFRLDRVRLFQNAWEAMM